MVLAIGLLTNFAFFGGGCCFAPAESGVCLGSSCATLLRRAFRGHELGLVVEIDFRRLSRLFGGQFEVFGLVEAGE